MMVVCIFDTYMVITYSGGIKNPDLLLFYQKKKNESETAKHITINS